MWCICCWQLRKDAANDDARQHLSQLQPVQENVAQARVMIQKQQYEHAIQMLAHPIEVCQVVIVHA